MKNTFTMISAGLFAALMAGPAVAAEKLNYYCRVISGGVALVIRIFRPLKKA